MAHQNNHMQRLSTTWQGTTQDRKKAACMYLGTADQYCMMNNCAELMRFTITAAVFAQAQPRTLKRMPGKRDNSELDVDQLRAELQVTKRRATMLEAELKRRTCNHNFEFRHVSGPRDNGEHELVCSKCGLTY